jgi:serine/threonine-protein kinase RsbW
MKPTDTVSVCIPLKAEYVSVARLTASGIASREGFDIDTIEDIKVALSEVLGKIIEKNPLSDRINIDFICQSDGIRINIDIPDDIPDLFDNEDDKFALSIIRSLMDEMEIVKQEHIITMVKKLGEAV